MYVHCEHYTLYVTLGNLRYGRRQLKDDGYQHNEIHLVQKKLIIESVLEV
jgi:hypothetical protein